MIKKKEIIVEKEKKQKIYQKKRSDESKCEGVKY